MDNSKPLNNIILRFVKAAAFLCILGVVVFCLWKTVERKDSDEKYADFGKVSDQLDVLFLGSSHVINAVDPVQLYEDYGITSYNMGGHGSILPETYWELMLALEHCTPKVVVVDTYMLEKDYHLIDVPCEDLAEADVAAGVEQLHLNMDYWPYSATKKAAVADLISDPDTQRAFLYDFAVYHNRWDELTADDYAWLSGSSGQNKNCLLGAEQRFAVEADPDVTNPEDAAAAIAQNDVTNPRDAAAAIAQNDVTNPGDVAAAIAQDDVTNPEDAAAAIAQNDVTNPGDVAADGTGGAASDTPGGYDAASGLTLAAATPVPTLGRETEGTKYLRKIIETCQDRGIDVVLTFLPMAKYSELDYMSTGSAAAIAAEYDIPFINMLAQDSVVDYYTDMNDNGHLNAGGMQKVTSYIGDWLDINTELEDHRINAISGDNASTTSDNDATSAGKDGAHDYAYWDELVTRYHAEMTDAVLCQTDLYSELLSLERTNDSFFIYVKADSLAITDDEVNCFAGAIAGNEESGIATMNPSTGVIGPYLLYRNPATDTTIEFSGEAQPDLFDTVCGSTEYIGVSNFAAIYLNGDEETSLLDMEKHYESDVQIVILDSDTGEIRSRLYYDHDADTFTLAEQVSE